MTTQNVVGSVPVVSLSPPPEGTKAAAISLTLTTAAPYAAQSLQLNSQAGLMMSQVVTAIVDNTENGVSVTIVHGALNQTIVVPPYTEIIFPTFSTTGSYAVSASCVDPNLTTAIVNITLLNYEKEVGSYNNAQVSSTTATTLVSATYPLTGLGITNLSLHFGNYTVSEYEMRLSAAVTSASGGWVIAGLINDVASGAIPIATFFYEGLGAASGVQSVGNAVLSQRTFPSGFTCLQNSMIELQITSFTNLTNADITINMSGTYSPT